MARNKLRCTEHQERVHVFARGAVHRKTGYRCPTETVEIGDKVILVSEFYGKDIHR